jgi:hypothetical protein
LILYIYISLVDLKFSKGRSFVIFFPRISERRILLKMEIFYIHLYIYILIYSHLLIFTSSQIPTFISSHLLTFTYSHLHLHISSSLRLHIFTSSHIFSLSLALHLHIFIFSYLHRPISSHFHIFSSSYLLSVSFPLSLVLCYDLSPSFFFFLKAAGKIDKAPRYGYPFARNEVRVAKIEIIL